MIIDFIEHNSLQHYYANSASVAAAGSIVLLLITQTARKLSESLGPTYWMLSLVSANMEQIVYNVTGWVEFKIK